MGALNPGDMLKDHKGVLLPLLAAVVLILGLGYFYGEGGDFLDSGEIVNPERESYDSYPEMTLEDGVDYKATIKTNYGDIEVNLFEDSAPKTVNNFVFLSEEDFYDGLTFHRVVPGFVIQGGDPEGDGTGGPGYEFEDEINPKSLGLDDVLVEDADFLETLYNPNNSASAPYSPSSLSMHSKKSLEDFYSDVVGYDYTYSLESVPFSPGVLAMANSGPNTNGSQFFITVSSSEASYLDGRHTVFGEIIDGMDVVDEISQVNTQGANKPVKEVEIKEIRIEED